jgi:hypothetical protein
VVNNEATRHPRLGADAADSEAFDAALRKVSEARLDDLGDRLGGLIGERHEFQAEIADARFGEQGLCVLRLARGDPVFLARI